MSRIAELKSLRNLRPFVDANFMLRIDGRLENAELPLDTRHPLILPSKHALTRLIVLHENIEAGHAGPSYTLMRTRQQFWIIHGISSVTSILSKCSKCARRKATPIRQQWPIRRHVVSQSLTSRLNFVVLTILELILIGKTAAIVRLGDFCSRVYALRAYTLN